LFIDLFKGTVHPKMKMNIFDEFLVVDHCYIGS